jgi:hypothetical protein
MPHPNGLPTVNELRSMSEDELMAEADKAYSHSSRAPFYFSLGGLYLDEVVRRPQDRATKTMVRLTQAITGLTVVLVIGLGVQIYLCG